MYDDHRSSLNEVSVKNIPASITLTSVLISYPYQYICNIWRQSSSGSCCPYVDSIGTKLSGSGHRADTYTTRIQINDH